MSAAQQLSMSLPEDLAEALEERVASGAYPSVSEVVHEGLRLLFAREQATETWLRTEVTASIDELGADPSRAISAADMRTHHTG